MLATESPTIKTDIKEYVTTKGVRHLYLVGESNINIMTRVFCGIKLDGPSSTYKEEDKKTCDSCLDTAINITRDV